MTPFVLEGASLSSEWSRFVEESAKWKPSGYDAEMARRLRFYLDQQLDDTRAELKKRFPETWEAMAPVTFPFVPHLIREKAKVFLATTKLDLVQDGKPLAASEDSTPSPIVDAWERAKERGGLALRLKRVDAYTQLMRTCFLRVGHTPGRFTFHVVFPHQVRVVMDPAAPMDLDRAYGVAVELGSEAGLGQGARRWEFWCAREGAEQHLVIEESQEADGKLRASIADTEKGDPLRAPDDRAIVPLVAFAAHTEELGLFTLEGADLVPTNLFLNILLTDIHNIAEAQGFGVMVVETEAGGKAPGKIVRSPNTAISLDPGVKASFLNANAPLADLVALAQTRIKLHATFYGVPPGRVSIEARAASSGIALQIEERPLTEARQDQIDVYREPMRRLWEVFWATYNAFADEANAPVGKLDPDLEMRWTPGDMQMPVDDAARLDNVLGKLKSKLVSRAEAVAELRGISVEEAQAVIKRIDAEEGAEAEEDPDPLGLGEKKKELRREEPEEPVDPPAPE